MADEEDLDALWNDAAPRRPVAVQQQQQGGDTDSSEEDSYFEGGSDGDSQDSAARRARDAEARLRDFGEAECQASAAAAAAAVGVLPSAAAAFTSVGGPPAFLDPEATRPLAVVAHRAVSHVGADGSAAPDPKSYNRGTNKRGQGAGEWDVSQMAPKLKDSELEQERGVITGSAVRYRSSEGGGGVSAAQIAMLGGAMGGDDDGESAPGGSGRRPGPTAAPGGSKAAGGGKAAAASKAMAVDDFLEKGVGGAQLPRKRQDRKDKEKDKRLKGQSTHASWKTEAEMALRQQYDS